MTPSSQDSIKFIKKNNDQSFDRDSNDVPLELNFPRIIDRNPFDNSLESSISSIHLAP